LQQRIEGLMAIDAKRVFNFGCRVFPIGLLGGRDFDSHLVVAVTRKADRQGDKNRHQGAAFTRAGKKLADQQKSATGSNPLPGHVHRLPACQSQSPETACRVQQHKQQHCEVRNAATDCLSFSPETISYPGYKEQQPEHHQRDASPAGGSRAIGRQQHLCHKQANGYPLQRLAEAVLVRGFGNRLTGIL
jgi:hypothetical protein